MKQNSYVGIILGIVAAAFIVVLVAANWKRIWGSRSDAKDNAKFSVSTDGTDPISQKSNDPEEIILNPPSLDPQTLIPEEIVVPELVILPEQPDETPVSPDKTTTDKTVADKTRALYFIRIDQNGDLHSTAVRRSLADTDSPLTDSIAALLVGISDREGLISLIPENTKIMSVMIQKGTAYISFSENFLYNTYGKEGYIAQLKQIIWTATEFPTVKDVQILIEGRKESFLGDDIFIGEPLNRESFPK